MNKIIKKELVLLEDLGYKFPKETSKQKKKFGLFKCFCEKQFETQISRVKSGNTKSCGCNKIHHINKLIKNNITHNFKNHRLYQTWYDMIRRCDNPKRKDYVYYGKRNIKVCDRWLEIKNFIDDMYPSFVEGLTLDRIDTNGNYEKDNCRWADKKTQSRNTKILQSNNKTGYRGVVNYGNKFKSMICINYQVVKIGVFNTPIEAAKAYDNYVILHNLEHTKNFS